MVPSPPRRILVVEDEAMVALQLKALLESLGHSLVGPAASLEQALALIQSDEIDAALLDLKLADGDSIPAAEVLLKRNIPFAFTTGFGPEALPGQLHAVPWLAKPYRDEDVHALIATLLRA
jgi:CheY-like chemotaxis protein